MGCYLIIPTITGLLVMRVLQHNQSCVTHYLYNNSAVTLDLYGCNTMVNRCHLHCCGHLNRLQGMGDGMSAGYR